MKNNLNVQSQLQALQDAWDSGAVDGYDSSPNTLPECAVKPYSQCTAYERGYLFGRELRQRERMDEEC